MKQLHMVLAALLLAAGAADAKPSQHAPRPADPAPATAPRPQPAAVAPPAATDGPTSGSWGKKFGTPEVKASEPEEDTTAAKPVAAERDKAPRR
jgi:hypothetical protein